MSMPMIAGTTMTPEEFLAHDFSELQGRYQLIEGEVVVEFATLLHQRAVRRILTSLTIWCDAATGRGEPTIEIDTEAGPRSIVAPDVQWYAEDRDLGDPTTRPKPLGNIVVEVRSPSTWSLDVGRKKALYEREGVLELWLVDPQSRSVLVYCRSSPQAADFDVAFDLADTDELTSPQLPGFVMAVARIFER